MKYYAIDFDNTLITGHYRCGAVPIDRIDYTTVDMVKGFISSGHEVGIATYNENVEIISEFCELVFGITLPVEGFLPHDFDTGKEEHIDKLFPGVRADLITLVDDNVNNINVASDYGHQTMIVIR
jgi:hypothetical protein